MVTSAPEAYVRPDITGAGWTASEVDTGCTGFLTMPTGLVAKP